MSTIKVNSIKNTSTDDGGIAIDNSGHVQIDGQQLPTAGALSSRRLNVNGAMQVAQRGTSLSLAQTTERTLDMVRYHAVNLDSYTCTVAQDSEAPSGFSNSFKLTTGTAETPGSDEILYIAQQIEAQDLQHLQYGTSSAQSTTLSFWVRSSQTGTFGVTIFQSDGNDLINGTYSISTADTWEHKTIIFSGNTAAAPSNDTGEGFRISWIIGAGSGFLGTTQTAWGAYSNEAYGGDHAQNGVMTTASATWYLTGVQLEVGEKATPFEHRSFGDELARCQRYFCKSSAYDVFPTVGDNHDTTGKYFASILNAYQANNGYTPFFTFPVTMRTTPSTIVFYPTSLGSETPLANRISVYDSANSGWRIGTAVVQSSTDRGVSLNSTGTWDAGSNLFYGAFTASAEL